MFVAISNTPRPYAWGSHEAIAALFGRASSSEPEAELWLGAHPGSPSAIVDPSITGGATDLASWIAADPVLTLGSFAPGGRLPFLLKLLAAAAPLSLQAHPTTAQAREGFRRENEAGVPLDAPERNYRDEHPKPELIYALSDTFEALCGFRSLESFRRAIKELQVAAPQGALDGLLGRAATDDALPGLVEWLSNRGPEVDELVSLVSALAAGVVSPADRGEGATDSPTGEFAAEFIAEFNTEFNTVAGLAEQYPGDPGIVISLLLNRVTLRRGEALYLPAGNIHAYLTGFGVELMAASDNVLRGGLTPKHVDVPELMSVLDFTPRSVPYLRAERPAAGVEVFRPDVPDFVLVRFDTSAPAEWTTTGPAIALCTSGHVVVDGAASVRLGAGDAVYITPDEAAITVTGDGELFLATTRLLPTPGE